MIKLILFYVCLSPNLAFAKNLPSPIFSPIFLKKGFSTVLQFDEAPREVVLGDQRAFFVQKLSDSLVIKPLVPNAISDMFVYFPSEPPRLFVLTTSRHDTPTFFKEFNTITATPSNFMRPQDDLSHKAPTRTAWVYRQMLRVLSAKFSPKKNYLTVSAVITASGFRRLKPEWKSVYLKYYGRIIHPKKLWSERREVEKDSSIKCRFIFLKPNLSLKLWLVNLVIPLSDKHSLEARL